MGKKPKLNMKMKRMLTFLMAMLGVILGCSRHGYENMGVKEFAQLVAGSDAVVLDVRTAEEFAEEHLSCAINIDVKGEDFLTLARDVLPREGCIAVYCRSGRRSALACSMLAREGYQVVNLEGGILAWKEEGQPVTK